jgi:hypothetical protein
LPLSFSNQKDYAMPAKSATEYTRRELIEELLDVINMNIWDLSDGELEDLGEFLGYDVETKKHGIYDVQNLTNSDD